MSDPCALHPDQSADRMDARHFQTRGRSFLTRKGKERAREIDSSSHLFDINNDRGTVQTHPQGVPHDRSPSRQGPSPAPPRLYPTQQLFTTSRPLPTPRHQGRYEAAPAGGQTAEEPAHHRSLSLPNLRALQRQPRHEVNKDGQEPTCREARLTALSNFAANPSRRTSSRSSSHATPSKSTTRIFGGVYGAITIARPRVVLVESTLAEESSDSSELIISLPTATRQPPVRFLDAQAKRVQNRSASDDEKERSSVRRVLRETEESQDERAAWSDSAVRGVAYRLNSRLAERDRKRNRHRAAAMYRHEEAKCRTALASESDNEVDAVPHSLIRFRDIKSPIALPVSPHPGRPGPEPSPPVPTSFQPFAWHARSQSQPHRASSQKHGLSRKDVIGSLKRLARRGSSAVRPSASRSSLASADQTRHVLGQPIRHLCRSASTDSFVHLDTSANSSSSTLDIRAGGSTERAGEAVTAPLTVGHSGRKPSVANQNAFISLPPHLHHLLRASEASDDTPLRRASWASSESGLSSLARRAVSSPRSDTSSVEAAKLALALADQLSSQHSPSRMQTHAGASRGFARSTDPNEGLDRRLSMRHPYAMASPPRPRQGSSDRSKYSASSDAQSGSLSSDLPVLHDLSNFVSTKSSYLWFASSFAHVILMSFSEWAQFFRTPSRASPRVPGGSDRRASFSGAQFSTSSGVQLEPGIEPPIVSTVGAAHKVEQGSSMTTPSWSPARRSTRSTTTASPSLWEARPAPTWRQQPHSPSSFGRQYAGSDQLMGPRIAATEWDDCAPRSSVLSSFLRLSLHGDEASRRDDRDCTSPASFMEFSNDEGRFGANLSPVADSAAEMSSLAPPQTGGEPTAQRPHHLSINSTVFLHPFQPPSSPYFTSEASRESTLNAKLDDFPAPPSLAASPSSGAGECFDEFGQSRSPHTRQGDIRAGSAEAVARGDTEPAGGGLGEERPPSSESSWFGDSSDSDV